ncbi:hypothetical protein AXG93_517s1270 [Marchantia polymorpha subsp. ruderalis]|uniref:Uncharacterized protein n=1 Tax=Marchantia polymorpha subsp. ruderalis TaxID=1480154 RepID=A0A176VJT4_MARPO|nr:hypothetical protein AXG93_517s1270 [Marchantia polymorpha subsp. ruderalis]
MYITPVGWTCESLQGKARQGRAWQGKAQLTTFLWMIIGPALHDYVAASARSLTPNDHEPLIVEWIYWKPSQAKPSSHAKLSQVKPSPAAAPPTTTSINVNHAMKRYQCLQERQGSRKVMVAKGINMSRDRGQWSAGGWAHGEEGGEAGHLVQDEDCISSIDLTADWLEPVASMSPVCLDEYSPMPSTKNRL